MEQPPSAFLIIGHPGHELQIHHWLETVRPRVFALTDGSGADGAGRLHASRACLAAVGAEAGGVFGPLSDRAWYQVLLAADPGPLLACGRAILAEALDRRPSLIVSDGAEGYNPLHDLAAALAQTVCQALATRGVVIERRSFPVAGPIRTDRPLSELRLDAPSVARKLAAAGAYAGLEGEIEQRLAEPGFELAAERFYRPEPEPPPNWRPGYETVGKARVALGRYPAAIEYTRHLRPLIEVLRRELVGEALTAG